MTFLAVYQFVDNNGQVAEAKMRYPESGGYDSAALNATLLAGAMAAVSSATLTGFSITKTVEIADISAAPPGSTVDFAGILFYRNGTDLASFRLPGLTRLLAESVGDYAGVRATRASADLLGLLETLDSLLEGSLDPVGRPYGTVFVVGGYDSL